MRVRFRISILSNGKKLKRGDFSGKNDPLSLGMRYITEFKYLEASKWLQLAPDCYEKYYLLGLLSEALGQEEEAREFFRSAEGLRRLTDYEFLRELS